MAKPITAIVRVFIALVTLVAFIVYISYSKHTFQHNSNLPVIAIANYGPHVSLQQSILGLKAELSRLGFADHAQIEYDSADVSFDPALIAQMLIKLRLKQPKLMVVMTTPVAQFAKNTIRDLPLVFNVITDPVAAGLLQTANQPAANISGSSDKQDLQQLLLFAKQLLPQAKTVGVLYASSELNDHALVQMLQQAAKATGFNVVAVPVNEARDVPLRMQSFKNKVDLIYVGVSGPIQPALPAIAANANAMHIPVFNADSTAVKQGQVLASMGVDYYQVGVNAGKIVARILKGENINSIAPIYPSATDHHGFISKKVAAQLGVKIPANLNNITIVE